METYLNLTKAFDTNSHVHLIYKLDKFGMGGTFKVLIESYLYKFTKSCCTVLYSVQSVLKILSCVTQLNCQCKGRIQTVAVQMDKQLKWTDHINELREKIGAPYTNAMN